MASINLKLITPAKGRVSLGSTGNLGPKSKLQALPASYLDRVPRVDARARIARRSVINVLSSGRSAAVPRQPLGAIGGSGDKAAPGSFLPSSAAGKVVL